MSAYVHAKRGCNYVVATLGLAVLLSVGVGQASAQTIFYPNDDFTDATPVFGESGQDAGTNAGATKEWGEPDHAGLPGGKSVWWRWTAPSTGDVAIDTTGSGIGTVLAVYVGPSVDDLAFVASNAAGGAKSEVFFAALEGRTYAIAVDGVDGSSGDIILNWALQPWSNLGAMRVPWFVDTAAPR